MQLHFGGVDNFAEVGKGAMARYITSLYYCYATMTTVRLSHLPLLYSTWMPHRYARGIQDLLDAC
eukprot:COSAG05_NODE_436_length_9838_cov_49.389876_12_plen_65_part_00